MAEISDSAINVIPEELKTKANEFLNSQRHANNILDIVAQLEECTTKKLPVIPTILALEVINVELLKRCKMCIEITPLKPSEKDESVTTKYCKWLRERYEEAWTAILNCIDVCSSPSDSIQALITCMKLLATEAKYPLEKTAIGSFPKKRLRNVLRKLISERRSQSLVINQFKEYAAYMDILHHTWKLLPHLSSRTLFKNQVFALNFLEVINALPGPETLPDENYFWCHEEPDVEEEYDHEVTRKFINKTWNHIIQWCDELGEEAHKQILIVLIEKIMPFLDKPILLTDFLMDSLDCGGTVGMLALQGVFLLVKKHNIAYPQIYEKLYSMFEPEIFHTKYKARLFYLADIFLTSTHLPEGLVAAFVKRLARLSLIAPPQDAIIILYFIGNLILRHKGLKRLICAESAEELPCDPFVMEERVPINSKALDSSLWEIVFLQKHALPSVSTAAHFISQPFPSVEWDLSDVLELKEENIFDEEITICAKKYALGFERPLKLFLAKDDKVMQYWKLY